MNPSIIAKLRQPLSMGSRLLDSWSFRNPPDWYPWKLKHCNTKSINPQEECLCKKVVKKMSSQTDASFCSKELDTSVCHQTCLDSCHTKARQGTSVLPIRGMVSCEKNGEARPNLPASAHPYLSLGSSSSTLRIFVATFRGVMQMTRCQQGRQMLRPRV